MLRLTRNIELHIYFLSVCSCDEWSCLTLGILRTEHRMLDVVIYLS